MPEVWCWYRNVYGWNRSLWSAVRVDAGKHVDFTAVPYCLLLEGVELLIFTTDKASGRAAVSQGGVGKRWKNHGVFLRYSYSSGLILPLLASDTPVLALDVLRA